MKFDKEAVKAAMSEFLTSLGYPSMTNREILAQVPNLYRVLHVKGLLPPQMSYEVFRQIAVVKYTESELKREAI